VSGLLAILSYLNARSVAEYVLFILNTDYRINVLRIRQWFQENWLMMRVASTRQWRARHFRFDLSSGIMREGNGTIILL
jgi:hypothetical protein